MSYYIYKHYNKDLEVIYVGLTTDIDGRQSSHKTSSHWKSEIHKIEYAEVTDSMLMEIYEKYYIDKHLPKYNIKSIDCQYTRFFKNMEELEFKEYIEVKTKIKKSKSERLYAEFCIFIDNMFNDYEKYGGSYNAKKKILTINGKSKFNVPSGYYRDGNSSVGFYLIESTRWNKGKDIIKIEYKLNEISDRSTKIYGEYGLENIIKRKLKEYNLIE